MNANLIDLRRRPKHILEAVEKRETVILSRRGKPIAKIAPLTDKISPSPDTHEAFGMWKDQNVISVEDQVRELRKGRFNDL